MKRIVALLVAAMMLFACAAATADTQIGQSICAAHGTKCFSVLTVANGNYRAVDSHIKRLRQKLDAYDHPSFSVTTVWGSGYKLVRNNE